MNSFRFVGVQSWPQFRQGFLAWNYTRSKGDRIRLDLIASPAITQNKKHLPIGQMFLFLTS